MGTGRILDEKRHTPEQIVRKLREADVELAAGASGPEVARRLGISEATFHRWRNHYGGMKADAMKRLKELESENARLKKIVADQAGLKVPTRSRERKRRRLGSSENGCTRRRAEHVDHVWSYDFAMDATEDGRRLKIMPIVDEYSRECLALEAERSITAEDVIETLDRLFDERGEPT